jgi:hydrogenase nickel incorporation protein HypA/HybF
MHETAVAQSLVDAICAEADKHSARPIAAKMSCGELNGVNDEVLSFAFEALANGTPCEGLVLRIEHKPMQATCRACGGSFAVRLSGAQCPNCSSDDFDLLPDAPLVLEEIEFDKE